MNDAERKLDALIAEKVMGLTILTREEMEAEALRVWPEQPQCRSFMKGFWAWPNPDGSVERVEQDFKRYSADITAAWEVVLKMRETHWAHIDGIGRPHPCWRATFNRMSDPVTGERFPDFVQIADTAPLAICRAALLALDKTSPMRDIGSSHHSVT